MKRINKVNNYICTLDEIPLFVDVAYVAELMKVNPRTIQREIAAGKIKAIKIGKLYRIPKEEVVRLYKVS